MSKRGASEKVDENACLGCIGNNSERICAALKKQDACQAENRKEGNTGALQTLEQIFPGVQFVDCTPKSARGANWKKATGVVDALHLVLGVDPGFHTGLALVDFDAQKCIWQATVAGSDALNTISGNIKGAADSIVGAVVQTPIFQSGKTPRWNKSPVSLAKNAELSGKIAGFLQGRGVAVQMVHPTRRSGMKMDAKLWAKAFKYPGRTSEHARDAANLAMAWQATKGGKG